MLRCILFACLICASCVRNFNTTATPKLIGGSEAYEAELPSAVMLEHEGRAACSMTKVGARHFLTAAHCVVDKGQKALRTRFLAGRPLTLRYGIVHSEMEKYQLTIYETRVPQEYFESSTQTEANLDIALIVVDEETPKIPAAKLDENVLRVDQEIYLSGFGCEDLSDRNTERRLKLGKTVVSELNEWRVVVGAFNRFGEQVEGCTGDSGSGAWIAKNGEMRLVGINSSIRPSVATFLTRLDASGPHNLTHWIAAGLRTTAHLAQQPLFSLECSRQQIGEHEVFLKPLPLLQMKFDLITAPEKATLQLQSDGAQKELTLARQPEGNYSGTLPLSNGISQQWKLWIEEPRRLTIQECNDTCKPVAEFPLTGCDLRARGARLTALKQTVLRQQISDSGEHCRLKEGELIKADVVELAARPLLKVTLSASENRCAKGDWFVNGVDVELKRE